MTQYFEDFRGETLDSIPADFSVVWEGPLSLLIKSGDPLAGSDRHLQMLPTAFGGFRRTAVKWDVGTTSGKTTVRLLVGLDKGNYIPGPFLSGSGDSLTRTGYVSWWGSNNRISKYNNGSDSSIGSGISQASASLPQTNYLEIIRDGALIEVRAWDVLGSRPAAAAVSVTDGTPLPVDGFFGVSHLSNNLDGLKVYEIAVGTNGDSAPTGPVATGPVTPINLSTTNILSTSARLGWE